MLLLTCINAKNAQNVYTFLDKHLEAFQKLPEEKQNEFMIFLSQLMSDYPFENSINSVSGPFREIQKKRNSSTAGDRIADFLKEDITNDPYNFTNKAADLINETVGIKPGKG